MNKSTLRMRYWRITFFFARLIASFIWWEIILRHLGFRNWSRRTRSDRFRNSASPIPKTCHPHGWRDDQGGAVPVSPVGYPST